MEGNQEEVFRKKLIIHSSTLKEFKLALEDTSDPATQAVKVEIKRQLCDFLAHDSEMAYKAIRDAYLRDAALRIGTENKKETLLN